MPSFAPISGTPISAVPQFAAGGAKGGGGGFWSNNPYGLPWTRKRKRTQHHELSDGTTAIAESTALRPNILLQSSGRTSLFSVIKERSRGPRRPLPALDSFHAGPVGSGPVLRLYESQRRR